MNQNWSPSFSPANLSLFEEAIVKCTQTLHSRQGADVSIRTLLEILGQFYKANSCHVFEFDSETQVFDKKFQWTSQLQLLPEDQFEELPFSSLEYFNYDQGELEEISFLSYDCSEFPDLPLSKLLGSYKIKNIMIYPMMQGDIPTGFVSVANYSPWELDNRLFHCVTLFIQESLQKEAIHSQLAELHNLDSLTGCYNVAQYQTKLKKLEQNPPAQLGIVFAEIIGLDKTRELYGSNFADVKVKNAAAILNLFFDLPFYRLEDNKFICFVLNIEEGPFQSMVEQLRVETTSNSDACFTVGHTWCCGTVDVYQEIARSNHFLQRDGASFSKGAKTFLSPTECLLKDLKRAIQKDDFVVLLQSKVDLNSRKVMGAEALSRRLLRKTGELVSPEIFVPLYEHHSIIRFLDLHILDKVCETLSIWKNSGHIVPISVNFSRVTLMEPGISEAIAEVCRRHEIPPHLVQLEITERLGSSPDDLSNLVGDDFKKLGLELVLDDFGSTYSNFLTLTKVDIKEVKIDHSLVENMENNVKNQKILKSITQMCKNIGNTISLAEGVETQAQFELLRELGCVYGQGFYFSQPLPTEEFRETFLSESNRDLGG